LFPGNRAVRVCRYETQGGVLSRLILAINPGSTSDEISLFNGEEQVFRRTTRYSPPDLARFDGKKITAQYHFRKDFVLKVLRDEKVDIGKLDAVIGRGGLLKPIPGGTYEVNDRMAKDLENGVLGDHASNLGGLIAREIAIRAGTRAFIADPVVVDEMEPLARYSGMPENPRLSIFHALNQKRTARLAAEKIGKPYEECRFIVMHAGGGISVGAHSNGKVVDVNNALDGEGPFTPQRSGGVPSGGLAKMCFSGKYDHGAVKAKIKGKGGLTAYTGTSDCKALNEYILRGVVTPGAGLDPSVTTREAARESLLAMSYQISKEICAMAAVLKGRIDAIILTGGLAYDDEIVIPDIRERVGWLAQILVFPGGDEMRALRDAAEMALTEPGSIKQYI